MNEDVYGLDMSVYYGFGVRVMYLSAPAKDGAARRPILPIRHVPMAGGVATIEEVTEDLTWGITEAVTRWGVNFGPGTDGNADYHAVWGAIAERNKRASGRAAMLQFASGSVSIEPGKLFLMINEAASGGWIGYIVHETPIPNIATLTKSQIVQLAADFANRIHPLIAEKMVARPTPSMPKPGKATPKASATAVDLPIPFGPKSTWIAVRSTDPPAVAKALHLTRVTRCSWQAGLDGVASQVFITPPLNGWVLAVGDVLPADTAPGQADRHQEWFAALARAFPEVVYFSTHRVVEWHAWARAVKGKIVRRFAWLGEAGATVWNEGKPAPAETKLGLRFPIRATSPALPDEDHVLALAGAWSINPMTLEGVGSAPGPGWQGKLPGRR